ncbi:MAG: DUF1995 family protein [Limnoraphis sp. WC205]|jgi:hypothetical protein|nr:DUF1995 family protein [Limnoraphis sp. WC205]
MTQLPTSIEEAVEQATQATQAALNDGYKLLQVELVFPEIELQAQAIAQQFIPAIEQSDLILKVFFPDTGAAALARRDWGETSFRVSDLGSSRSPIESRLQDDDGRFLVVSPAAVEVEQVEKLSRLAGDRATILLNPRLEDVAIIGIGYAARALRERFINTIESCYYLRPLEGDVVLYRCYPSLWEVWQEIDGEYQLITQEQTKPVGDQLDQILAGTSPSQGDSTESAKPQPKKQSFLAGLQSFLNALSR